MTSGVRCFLIEPTERARISLRRFCYSDGPAAACSASHCGTHDAEVLVGEGPIVASRDGRPGTYPCDLPRQPYDGDPRWPSACACGYIFRRADQAQVRQVRIYVRKDTGEETTLRDALPGAMYDATWCHAYPQWCGPDGRSLIVRCPNGRDWHIDSRASNCTLPNDNTHRCWCRHGIPPDLTVDKNPKPGSSTCSAGAGSIQAGDWHGYLRAGYLVVA